MKHTRQLFLLLGLCAFLTSCAAVHYRSPALREEAAFHQKVAVLPFTMVLTGKQPTAAGADSDPERPPRLAAPHSISGSVRSVTHTSRWLIVAVNCRRRSNSEHTDALGLGL